METEIELIMVDELEREIDDITIQCMVNVGDSAYAVVRKDDSTTFLKVVRDYKNQVMLEDITCDSEFEKVKKVYESRYN